MKLFLFELGRFIYPDAPKPIPVPGYLIQTKNGKNILVDTGFPEQYITNPPLSEGVTVAVNQEDFIVNRLAEIGLKPTDIDLVVLSHLDYDHAGNLLPFGHAEVIIQRLQYETAKVGHPRFLSTKDQWNDDSIKFRLIDGDQEIGAGIKLIESSGHVPGHQSIVLKLPETGPVLLTVDAVLNSSMTDGDNRPLDVSAVDDAQARISTKKLMKIAKEENVQLIIIGHDSEQWEKLEKAPSYSR
ncbi:N-acyl homoserine lactonase family protein [Pedobacter lithocola]|uniref:N-acyl homoserine lactonase family protein n=1 Tax=Pedobacter lithocola TaxID=1908239 RepID=A0ABV8PBA6_9SPHI